VNRTLFCRRSNLRYMLMMLCCNLSHYLKSSIFWDVTPCSPFKVNRRFGGTCRLHLQGREISQAGEQLETRWQPELCLQPALKPKRRLTFNGLHGIISQEIELLITTAVKISNPTYRSIIYVTNYLCYINLVLYLYTGNSTNRNLTDERNISEYQIHEDI
jgi:hypothetical protein